jgi:hypothetical protein
VELVARCSFWCRGACGHLGLLWHKARQASGGGAAPLNRNWKLLIMLMLVAAALAMSGFNFYHALHAQQGLVDIKLASDFTDVANPQENLQTTNLIVSVNVKNPGRPTILDTARLDFVTPSGKKLSML